jgi:hypothetical protein
MPVFTTGADGGWKEEKKEEGSAAAAAAGQDMESIKYFYANVSAAVDTAEETSSCIVNVVVQYPIRDEKKGSKERKERVYERKK